jgi:ketosteroid isomerase-like protein
VRYFRLGGSFCVCLVLISACATGASRDARLSPPGASAAAAADLRQEVVATERAFARTMSSRDHAAFTAFLSDEAIFFSGKVLRGKQAVADAWRRFFDGPEAPFSWEPAEVEVLDSGTLAISSGPVRNAQGQLIATFTSIWHREASGQWRIVFDKGNDVCERCDK